MSTTKTIGIVGGGQLGRMLTLAALPLGFKVVVIDPSENCPAKQVGAEQIVANLYDPKAIAELGKRADYITIEIEHFDVRSLQKLVDRGISVNPTPDTIKMIQDKLTQKTFLEKNGIPVAPFQSINSLQEAKTVFQEYGGHMLLKARRGGYDGRGNARVDSLQQLEKVWKQFNNTPLYAEALVDFKKELAVMLAIDIHGAVQTYPVVETVHTRNICVEVYAPAAIDTQVAKRATTLAKKVGKHLRGAGMYGIEMFLDATGQILINEIAPRVHNSGHITMDACVTSQFEQHIRAIAGLPLGSTSMLSPAAVMINVLGERDGPTNITGLDTVLKQPYTKVHLYGKSPTKVDRKMGHLNVLADSLTAGRNVARQARLQLGV